MTLPLTEIMNTSIPLVLEKARDGILPSVAGHRRGGRHAVDYPQLSVVAGHTQNF